MKKNCMKCGSSFECQENESCWCSQESKLSDKEITMMTAYVKIAYYYNTGRK